MESKVGIAVLVFIVAGLGGVFSLIGVKTGADIAAGKQAELTDTFHNLGVVSGTLVISTTVPVSETRAK